MGRVHSGCGVSNIGSALSELFVRATHFPSDSSLGLHLEISHRTRYILDMEPSHLEDVNQLLWRMVDRRPELAHIAESLVSSAMEGLLRWETRQSQSLSPEESRRVAATILKRRIVDHYRKHMEFVEYDLDSVVDEEASAFDRVGNRQLLAVVLQFTADLEAEDRNLMDHVMLGGSGLNTRERQRLSRMRARLKRYMEDKLGSDFEGKL